MSIKRRTIAEVLQQDILEREKQEEKQLSGHETNEFAFEPLNIPEPTEKQLEEIKSTPMRLLPVRGRAGKPGKPRENHEKYSLKKS